jgi:hypothetical protein
MAGAVSNRVFFDKLIIKISGVARKFLQREQASEKKIFKWDKI